MNSLEVREVWECAVASSDPEPGNIAERFGFAAITWTPSTMHLTLWIVPVTGKPMVYNTGLPSKIVKRWHELELRALSDDCQAKLSALEAARD